MADNMDRRMDLTLGQSNQQPHTLHSSKPTAMVFTCGQTDIRTRHYHAYDVLAHFLFIILVMSLILAWCCSLPQAKVSNKLSYTLAAHVTPFRFMVVAVSRKNTFFMNICKILNLSLMYTRTAHLLYDVLLSGPSLQHGKLRKNRTESCVKRFCLLKIRNIYVEGLKISQFIQNSSETIVEKSYLAYERFVENVTRPPKLRKISSVKKLSVIAHKRFGTRCHDKNYTYGNSLYPNAPIYDNNSKNEQCNIRILRKIDWQKVENVFVVLHLGFLGALFCMLRLSRLYDRFSSRQILPVLCIVFQCIFRIVNNRETPSRITTIKHTDIRSTRKNRKGKEMSKKLKKTLNYGNINTLSKGIDTDYLLQFSRASFRAKILWKVGMILMKMKCVYMMYFCMQKNVIMISVIPYPNINVFNSKVNFFEND